MIGALSRLLAWPLLGLVGLYRLAISPWLDSNCRFHPSCSKYASDALRTHGAFRGLSLTTRRILRCHPWGGSGYDPVPENGVWQKQRRNVLNHAYGLVSRGNRAGGLQHIYGALQDDPDALSAWSWYLEQMFRWENCAAALQFAQQYLSRLLHDDAYVDAVKLMMRCRLVDESFRPLPEDRSLALTAAEQCHNDDLLTSLR